MSRPPDFNPRGSQINFKPTDDRRNKYTEYDRSHKPREFEYRHDKDKFHDKERVYDREKYKDKDRRFVKEDYKHRYERDYNRNYDRDRIDDKKYIKDYPPQIQKPELADVPLNSLIEARGNLSKLIYKSDIRKQLSALFNGFPSEQWFLDELLSCFEILISRQSGITFIYTINHKIRQPIDHWHRAILMHVDDFLKYPSGFFTIIDVLKLLPDDECEETAEKLLSGIKEKADEQFILLYLTIIRKYIKNERIIGPLYDINWSELKGHQEIVVELISNSPSSAIDTIFSSYAPQISYMTQDVDFVHTICAFLEYGSKGVKDQIFASMMPSIKYLAMRDPSWNVLATLIITATNEQKMKISEILLQIIENSPTLPVHFDNLMHRLLLVMQIPDRKVYLGKLIPYLDKLNKPKFVEIVKYTSLLLDE